MIQVSFIINSSRKFSPLALRAITLAKQSSVLNVQEIRTDFSGHATELANQQASNCDIIVAVGGDGTFNEVIQGIVESGNATVKLALIPNGTGNDFTRMLDPFNPEKFVEALERNEGNGIDLGCCEFDTQTRYFINIADLGFGAKVIQVMTKQRDKKMTGKMSYSLAILRAFFSYKKKVVKIKGDNFEFEGKGLMIAFCNGTTFGYGLTINPDARLDNGKICVTVIGNISLLTYIRKLGKLKKGKKIVHPEAHYFESKSIEISNLEDGIWTEGDGELFGENLRRVSVLPERILLIS